MTTIPVIYESGVLKPLTQLHLPDHQRLVIVLFPSEDDVPTVLIDEAAVQGKSFDFLADPAENLYQLTDGEPL